MRTVAVLVAIAALAACQKDKGKSEPDKLAKVDNGTSLPKAGSGSGARPQVKQITPPFDTKTPPADAVKTGSGLIYKKIGSTAAPTEPSPGKNDTVKVHYTGWKTSGETVYSTEGRGQPMAMSLQQIPPGFAEAMLLMKKGEKAMLWIPPEIGYRDSARPSTPEPMAYQVELVDIEAAAPVPPDVGKPPVVAPGAKYPKVAVKPGTSKDKARYFDNATFNLTAWDSEGNQVESTETGAKKRPITQPVFRQPKGLEAMLLALTVGERGRFWVPREELTLRESPKAPGPIAVEIELLGVEKQKEPPPVPKDVAAPPAGTKKTDKGVSWKVLKPGKGKPPTANDTVSVHYTGWTTDGRMFDSSVVRGQPAEFPLGGVIPGWTDGLQQMHVGETARLWIPEDMAYKGQPGRPAGMLVFDVELLGIKPPPPGAPATPPDVAAPPKDAKKTDKGVFFKVLKRGAGGKSPGPTDTVKVHYSGWTTDGKMFDSSVTRGQPAEFPLNGVIAGWTDGLQQMKPGDSFRFWIPVELAYQHQAGKPDGMLVFDVELLEVKPAP